MVCAACESFQEATMASIEKATTAANIINETINNLLNNTAESTTLSDTDRNWSTR